MLNKYLPRACCVPGTVLGTETISVKRKTQSLFSWSTQSSGRKRETMNTINNQITLLDKFCEGKSRVWGIRNGEVGYNFKRNGQSSLSENVTCNSKVRKVRATWVSGDKALQAAGPACAKALR